MANPIQQLTSISPDLRSKPSPGRRLVALALCAMLALGAVLPGFAWAGEGESEGEGTAPVELPGLPDFDPGGEETELGEVPASGEEEGAVVELAPEVDPEVPAAGEMTGAPTQAPVEAAPPPVVAIPEPAPEPEPVPQQAPPEPAASEPIANQTILAPKQGPGERSEASRSAASSEGASPLEPAEQEAPASPQPVAATVADPGRNLAAKDSYVVRPGDCLWHIAADLLPGGTADALAVEREVERLWRLNEDRIGTGDPNLIYAGTELRLR